MTSTAFNIAMVFRADIASAKAGLAEVAKGQRDVSAEAGKTSTALAKEAAELERLAAATGKAALAQGDLAAAEKRAQATRAQTLIAPLAMPTQAAPVAAIWRQSATAAESLRGSVAGLSLSVGQQAHDMVAAAQASAAYQLALDDVRASFNPLFAVSRKYEQQLERIADAERQGAITAREAAEARTRAASIIAPVGQKGIAGGAGVGVNSANTANVAAQGFDIGVTAAMGTNPAMIGLQQGTQLVQVMQQMGGGKQALQGIATGFLSLLNPMSLATIGVVAFGAAGIQALMSLGGETKTSGEALADLADRVNRLKDANTAARQSVIDLGAEFGTSAAEAKELLALLAEIERRSAGRDAKTALNSITRDMDGGSLLGLRSASDQFATLQRLFGEANWATSGRISEEASPLSFAVRGAMDKVTAAGASNNIDAQIAAVKELRQAAEVAASAYGGVTKKEEAWLLQIAEAQRELQKIKALDENAAGNARADEMVRQLQQRVALERVALQYGQDSAEYRVAEQDQLRANTVLELQNLGFTEQDQKAKQVLGALASAYFAKEDMAAKARQDAQREYLQGQDDQIAAINRQVSLIGATRDEQARINALAEADLEIRRRSLSIDDAREVKAKAIAKAEAEITLERQKAMRAVQVAAIGDAYDAQISLARDPVSKANLEFQREYSARIADGQSVEVAYAEAIRARARAMSEVSTGTQTQIADMMSEVAIRRDLADQVAAGLIGATDVNRLLREELELRPLIAAAARAEGAEKVKLLDLIEGMRVAYAAMAAEEQRQNQNQYLRGQAERIQQLHLELALVGQTAEMRARVLAMVKAEQDIQRLGLSGKDADAARRNAEMEYELARSIEAQADAWQRVQSAGESAIDGVLDKLRGGDIKGAMGELLGEIEKGFFDLAIRNPLKNALLGTNLGTWADVGGWSGIMDRFSGRSQVDEKALARQAAMPVQSMMVTAANVVLSGNLSGIGAAANANLAPLSAANTNVAPLTYGSLPGSADIQTQIWQFFAAKGLAPHQIAGIMGNASAESGFNPLAQGDHKNGVAQAFGLFQWNDRKGNLFDFIGGQQNLGDIQKQLEFAWHELMTTEAGPMRRLMSSTDVASATWAMQGFERPSGYDANVYGSGKHFDKRLAAAEQALAQFGTAAQTAGTDLASSAGAAAAGLEQAGQGAAVASNGMGVFGQLLSGIGGMVGGEAGSILNAVVGIGGALLGGVPLFKQGGATGGSNPDRAAGIVHEGEFVFDAAATARIGIGNLEGIRKGAMRGFKTGGFVSSLPAPVAVPGNQPAAPTGRPDRLHVSVDIGGARGDREIEMMVQQAVSAGVAHGIELYDREALPTRIRQVSNDRWGG
ncbi:phage tail tip lysozyme [Paracoccus lutimaris]|uniref:Tail length tape measure protein n=1 Tax=Paracoccus lutimaris TaxID=1490030 RepID=A0A368YFF7_9RHOB|nr:phage tail tip lysozyme [Paracoccus lutimaris]RCW78076.1 tail length tape measure protein [Paracoccus lutimaris]